MKKFLPNFENSTQGSLNPITKRGVYFLAVISLGMCLIHVILTISQPGWLMMGSLLLWLTSLVSCLLAIVIFRKNRVKAALGILAFDIVFIILISPLLFRGSGLLVTFTGFLFTVFVLGDAISAKNIYLITGVGIVLAVITLFLDRFGGDGRQELFNPLVTNLIISIVGILILFLVLRQISIYSLRIKLVFSFLILTILLVFTVAWFSVQFTRSALITQGNQSLLSAANQVSLLLDNFLASNLESLQAEAQLSSLRNYLLSTEMTRSNESKALVEQELLNLSSKREFVGGELSPFIMGYILLDQEMNILLTVAASDYKGLQFDADFIKQVYQGQSTFISPVLFTNNNPPGILFFARITGSNNSLAGALMVVYDASVLQKILQTSNGMVGEGSTSLLIDEHYLRLGQGLADGNLYKLLSSRNDLEVKNLQDIARLPNVSSEELFELEGNFEAVIDPNSLSFVPYLSYFDATRINGKEYLTAATSLKYQPWLVLYSQERDRLLAPIQTQVRNIQFLSIVLAGVAILVAAGFARYLSKPITSITRVASQVAEGNLAARASVQSQDELGKLAGTINLMTNQLQHSLLEMEERVRNRTFELERRLRELQIAVDIGRIVATIHNLDDLLTRAAGLISERFGLYHIGIFIVDEAGEYVVLRAASSDGGKRMINRQYRLVIGHQGIVGQVASTGQRRIAQNVGEEAVTFDNPDLPHTSSEMTLPLISAGEILGVFDIQSTKSSAFTPDDLVVMQVLADLIAVAIENARLFSEGQNALETTRRAYGEISRQAWLERLAGRDGIVIRSQKRSTYQVDQGDPNRKVFGDVPQQVSLPIRVRDHIIGYLDTYKPLEQGYWTDDEEDTLNLLVEQIGIALESARLYEASQIQAERERLVGDFGAKLQETLDVDAVLKTAAFEIRQSLELKDLAIILKNPKNGEPETSDEQFRS